MAQQIIFLIFCFLFIAPFSKCQVMINYPESIQQEFTNKYGDQGYIDYSLATFGEVPYGSTLIVPLRIPQDDDIDGCKEYSNNTLYGTSESDINAFGLLLLRGNCTFASKAYYSQIMGAKIAVIVNNQDYEDLSMIVPIDDGNHPSVRIPLIIISNKDGLLLIEKIKNGISVELAISFDIPSISEGITVDYWVSPLHKDAYEFIASFEPFVRLLKSDIDVVFNIHFQVITLISSFFDMYDKTYSNCYGSGKYCAADPDNDGSLSGGYVLDLILTQKCIDIYFKQKNDNLGIWDFGKRYHTQCLVNGTIENLQNCSYGILQSMEIDYNFNDTISSVLNCTKDSFQDSDNKGTSTNTILDLELSAYNDMQIFMIPSLLVNGIFYRGNIEPHSLFSTICETIGQPNEEVQMYCFNKVPKKEIPTYLLTTIIVGILLTFIAVLAIAIYRFVVKKDIDKTLKIEIDASVDKYMKMRDIETSNDREQFLHHFCLT